MNVIERTSLPNTYLFALPSPPFFLTFTDMSTDLYDFSEGNRHVPSPHRPIRWRQMPAGSERDDRVQGHRIGHAPHLILSLAVGGVVCGVDCLRHSLVRAYGIRVNAQFELLQ